MTPPKTASERQPPSRSSSTTNPHSSPSAGRRTSTIGPWWRSDGGAATGLPPPCRTSGGRTVDPEAELEEARRHVQPRERVGRPGLHRRLRPRLDEPLDHIARVGELLGERRQRQPPRGDLPPLLPDLG